MHGELRLSPALGQSLHLIYSVYCYRYGSTETGSRGESRSSQGALVSQVSNKTEVLIGTCQLLAHKRSHLG